MAATLSHGSRTISESPYQEDAIRGLFAHADPSWPHERLCCTDTQDYERLLAIYPKRILFVEQLCLEHKEMRALRSEYQDHDIELVQATRTKWCLDRFHHGLATPDPLPFSPGLSGCDKVWMTSVENAAARIMLVGVLGLTLRASCL